MQQEVAHNFFDVVLDKTVKGVLIDFDNTFYIYEPCHRRALETASEEMWKIAGAVKNFSEVYDKAKNIVKGRINTQAASHSRVLYFQTMFELLGKGSMPEESARLEMVYWDSFIKEMQLTSGLLSFLGECRKKGMKIVVVSDLTANIQFRKMVALKVVHLVDFVVTSEEAGVEKPGSQIFALALEKAELKPENAVMIGDDFKKDIQGAENMGIRSIHIVHDQFSQKEPL